MKIIKEEHKIITLSLDERTFVLVRTSVKEALDNLIEEVEQYEDVGSPRFGDIPDEDVAVLRYQSERLEALYKVLTDQET